MQRKSLWRPLSPLFDPLPEHSITQTATSRGGLHIRLIIEGRGRYRRHPAEASKTCSLPPSNLPDHAFHPTNTFSPDRLCLICDVHCFGSCAVCDQDFCTNHLYVCLDCNNQYCSRCLDDHRADGHWSDSDTAAELTRGNSAAFLVRQEGLIFTFSRSLPFCGDRYCCRSRSGIDAGCSYLCSRLSQADTRSQFASLFVWISRSLRSCLLPFLAAPILKLLSQSEIFLEVSL